MRIIIAQVWKPEAQRPPTRVFFAASSSRCIGCGSNWRAKAMISSFVTILRPQS
jgi:hypothetical protein